MLLDTINVVETTYGYSIIFFPGETVLKKISTVKKQLLKQQQQNKNN